MIGVIASSCFTRKAVSFFCFCSMTFWRSRYEDLVIGLSFSSYCSMLNLPISGFRLFMKIRRAGDHIYFRIYSLKNLSLRSPINTFFFCLQDCIRVLIYVMEKLWAVASKRFCPTSAAFLNLSGFLCSWDFQVILGIFSLFHLIFFFFI